MARDAKTFRKWHKGNVVTAIDPFLYMRSCGSIYSQDTFQPRPWRCGDGGVYSNPLLHIDYADPDCNKNVNRHPIHVLGFPSTADMDSASFGSR